MSDWAKLVDTETDKHSIMPAFMSAIGTGNAFLDWLILMLVFAAFGVCIVALAGAASLSMQTASLLIDLVTDGASPDVLRTLILSGIAGVFAGMAAVTARFWDRVGMEQSFVSALFNGDLERLEVDGIFLGRVILGGAVGMLTGFIAGASGAISFTHLLDGSAFAVLNNPIYPLVGLIAGGAGGGEFGFFLLLVLAALVAMVIVAGILSGFVVHIILSGIGGLTKGATKEFIIDVLEEKPQPAGKEFGPVIEGLVRGMISGVLTGSIMAVCTAWGIFKFLR